MVEQSEPRLLEVGRVTKAHGLRGEVVVDFTTDRTEDRTQQGAELFVDGERHQVRSARPHQTKWLVQFDGVDGREHADRLRGATVTAYAVEDPDAVFVHEVIGKRLVDQYGTDHGPIVSVVENPASDLLELDDGRLVPLAFFTGQDELAVSVTVPAGLLNDD